MLLDGAACLCLCLCMSRVTMSRNLGRLSSSQDQCARVLRPPAFPPCDHQFFSDFAATVPSSGTQICLQQPLRSLRPLSTVTRSRGALRTHTHTHTHKIVSGAPHQALSDQRCAQLSAWGRSACSGTSAPPCPFLPGQEPWYCHPDTQRGHTTCPRSHSLKVAGQGLALWYSK